MKDEDGKITAWIADLDHPDKPRIRAAVDALTGLAAQWIDLRAALEQRLIDPERKNHWPVAYILGHLPQPSPGVVQALLDGLDHREPDIRWAIGLLLVRMAKAESHLVKPLMKLCAAGTANQKRMAIYCIRDLDLADAGSLELLLQSLRDDDATVRVAAATSLKTRADIDASARKALLDVLSDDPEPKVRNAAAITLAQLGSPSEEFLQALEKASKSDDAQIKKAAFAALALLQNKRSAPAGG
jgi:vesicle coat complex subunit